MKTRSLPAYTHGATSEPLLGETIGENLRRAAECFGDRPALIVRHQRYRATYRELWEQAGVAARALLARACVRATASASGRRTVLSG
jgi:fatty-acyl-CoA synthase